MNCETCQSLILDYLEEALPAEATRHVEAHAAGCPVCRMELALAQKIEVALSGRKLRMPPADFTARVLSALPATQTVGAFWSQMLPPLAYAASILALLLGLSRYLPYLSRLYEAWSDRVSTLALLLGIGWPEPSEEPGRLETLYRSVQDMAGDALAYTAAYGDQLQGLYSANAPTVHLTMVALALVWVVFDYRQGARE